MGALRVTVHPEEPSAHPPERSAAESKDLLPGFLRKVGIYEPHANEKRASGRAAEPALTAWVKVRF